jgi:DnaJ-domain-containing protein 1
MAKKGSGLLRALRTADDVCKLTTGKRLNQVMASAIDLFGDDIVNKVSSAGKAPTPEEMASKLNYVILGVSPEAPDFIVKAAYKQYMKECHPDTNKPDAEKAARINNAYEQICKERGIPK